MYMYVPMSILSVLTHACMQANSTHHIPFLRFLGGGSFCAADFCGLLWPTHCSVGAVSSSINKFSLSLLHICLRVHSLNLGKMELLIPHLALTSYTDVTETGAINVFVIHNAAGSVTVAVLKLYLKGLAGD